jgi:two-component system nitrogen regulation response regulator NtrX
VDVRIVSATNKDLQKAIETGQFRQDLYYRLNVIPLNVPPLRERLQDIPLLVQDFVTEMAYQTGMGRKEIDRQVIELMQQYHWPGNVRELRNFVERLIIMTPGQAIRPENLPKDFLSQLREPPADNDPFRFTTLREARNAFEREFLMRKLEENQWNVSLTASQIGVERSHLHRKMKALAIVESEAAPADA